MFGKLAQHRTDCHAGRVPEPNGPRRRRQGESLCSRTEQLQEGDGCRHQDLLCFLPVIRSAGGPSMARFELSRAAALRRPDCRRREPAGGTSVSPRGGCGRHAGWHDGRVTTTRRLVVDVWPAAVDVHLPMRCSSFDNTLT